MRFIESSLDDPGELRGQPTVCGNQPFISITWEEAVVLVTPPCTDAVQGNLHHRFVGIPCLNIPVHNLVLYKRREILPNVTSFPVQDGKGLSGSILREIDGIHRLYFTRI